MFHVHFPDYSNTLFSHFFKLSHSHVQLPLHSFFKLSPPFSNFRLLLLAPSRRMVIQPWHSLQILNLPHNKITHLDDSLQVLPVLREVRIYRSLEKYMISPRGIYTVCIHYTCLNNLVTR